MTHFFDKAEGTSNKPRVMVVACQMARTIVSKSDAPIVAHRLFDAYSNPCASLYREIVLRKDCESQVGVAMRAKVDGPRENSSALLVECIPER